MGRGNVFPRLSGTGLTSVEDIPRDKHANSDTLQEDGIWSALNHKEPRTKVVRSSLNGGTSRTTGDVAFPNSDKEGHNIIDTQRNDVLMSIREKQMQDIVRGIKNYEYRKSPIPQITKKVWFYTMSPVAAVQYVAQIGHTKQPGEVPEDGGLGNTDFNDGLKDSKFGYHIDNLWKLAAPIKLEQAMQKGYLQSPPRT